MAQETKRLSDLADFIGEQVDPALCLNSVYVGLEHVTSGRLVRVGNGKASDVRSSKFAFKAGDVLYGKLRPYLDKAVLAFDSGICTTELLVLRPKEGVDPRFLVSVIHTTPFIEHAISGTTGVQHPRTSWNHVGDFEVPAFDSSEQTKIADLLWAIHVAITANEAAIEATADLKRAAMRELLRGSRVSEWKTKTVGECLMEFRPVSAMKLQKSEYRRTGSYPILDQGQDPIAGWTDDVSVVIKQGLPVIVFVDHTRTFKFVDFPFVRGADGTQVLKPETSIDPLFFFYALQAIDLPSRGYNRHLGALKERDVAVPSTRREQEKISTILKAVDHKIDLHRRKLAVLNDLFKALLHKLMSGEIRVSDLNLSAFNTNPKVEAVA